MCALDGSATWRFISPLSSMDLMPPSRRSETEMVSLMTTCTLGKYKKVMRSSLREGVGAMALAFPGLQMEDCPGHLSESGSVVRLGRA